MRIGKAEPWPSLAGLALFQNELCAVCAVSSNEGNAASENHFWSGRVTRGPAVNIRDASSLLTPDDDGQTRTSRPSAPAAVEEFGLSCTTRDERKHGGSEAVKRTHSASGMRYPWSGPWSVAVKSGCLPTCSQIRIAKLGRWAQVYPVSCRLYPDSTIRKRAAAIFGS